LIRGLYTAASGALTAEAQADTIANNLANVDTAGFKRTLAQIGAAPTLDVLRIQTDPGQSSNKLTPGVSVAPQVGGLGTGAQILDTPAVFEQGALQHTGNGLDVAVANNANAFFTLQTPQGIRYTRDGEFARDPQGYLVTQDGARVLGRTGAILLPQGDVQIGADGTISQQGRAVDQLRLTRFANLANVRPEGDNRFVALAGARPAPVTTTATVSQGFLERSNANVVRSMVDLITAQRWFEANQKVIQTQDDATASAISEVGRTQH
jgi:flagellar basal-body rod protein FlgG